MIYKKRIIKLPENSHTFLFGVRGSGKTALLNKRFPSQQSLHIDLLDESLYQSYLSNVAQFYETISAFEKGGVIIVDEIQKMPELLNEVHRLIEESSRGEAPARQFILTGSSARKLKAPGVNLLAGRAGKTALHPFVPEELGEDFNLNSALKYGLLPIVWSHHDKELKLKSYAEEYLKEEIQATALVKNLPGFARFLEVAGLYHGQAINMSAISRECQTPKKAVQNYFSILEDTLLGFFLPAYTPRLQLRERKHKKFYFIDPGLARTVRKDFGPVSHAEKGSLFEGLIAQILRAYRDYHSLFEEMYYWSPVDSQKTEVDFLLRKREDLIAIEVKARTQVSSSECKGLKAIQKLPAVKKRILVYMGDTIRRSEDGIDIWPFDFFCQNLQEGNFNAPVVYTKKSKKKPELGLAIPSSNNIFTPRELQIPPPADETKFEQLCLDLYKQEFGEPTQLHSSKGQSQQGVDIFSQYEESEGSIGIQCKKREYPTGKITEQELQEEVEKAKSFEPPLKRFILATTCKRDANIQKTARLLTEKHSKNNLFSVEIHSWDEIKELLSKYPKVYQQYYGTTTDNIALNNREYAKKTTSTHSFNLDTIKEIKSENHHAELKRIQKLLNTNPKTALISLEDIKTREWDKLNNKVKYKVLIYMADAKAKMKDRNTAYGLIIQALQFNKEDEDARMNCAFAYWMKNNIEKSKEYLKKTRELNPHNISACNLEIQIQFKEGKSIKEIVAKLPEDIKNQAQIAQLLAHLSINQKDYQSAEKWLKIFYNNREKNESGGWKEIKDEAIYADLSLNLLLAKPNVFSGRRVPENLKEKLNNIIKNYKKLITDNQFSELKEFNPNWYLHYALALELSGDLDKAIQILQTGIDAFPEDEYLKLELSRLFEQTENITKSIEILEKQIGLHSSSSTSNISVKTEDAKFEQLHSFLSKKTDTTQDNMSEKPVTWALILTDLYFYNNQNEKALELLNQIIKNPSMDQEDNLEVEKYQVFQWLQAENIEEAEKTLNSFFEKNQDDVSTLILKSKLARAKTKALEGKTEESKEQENISIQSLKEAYKVFQNKNYSEETNSPYFENREWLRDIQQLAQELGLAKMYKEVEPLLEKITNQNLDHPEIFKLLHAYFENGKNRKAIKLAEALLKKFPDRIEPANTLFLIYEDLGDREKSIQYYENFMQHNPDNSQMKIELALTYIRNEQLDKAKALLNYTFNLSQLSVNEICRLALAYNHTDHLKKALDMLYQSLKKYPSNYDLQQFYSGLFFFRKEKLFLTSPKEVEVDCYVKIQELNTNEITEIIIEKTPDEKSANIYTPNHPFVQKFLRKTINSVIDHANKQYKILKIKNKYIQKLHEITNNAEKRFPVKPFIKTATVPKLATKEDIAQALKQVIPDTKKHKEKAFQYYAEGRMTIGYLSNIIGLHPIETMDFLWQSLEHKFISSLPGLENYKTSQEILNKKTDIIIDLTSLFILHSIKMEKHFEDSPFKLYICPSTIESVKELIQKMQQHSQDGLLMGGFDTQGKLITNHTPPEIIQRNLNFLDNMLKWAKEICAIKTVPVDYIQSRQEKSHIENIIGKEFLDPLLSSHNQKNIILLSEDGMIDALSKNDLNIFRVRLWDIIQFFKSQLIINDSQALQFKAKLIQLNQTYIPVDHELLLVLLKQAGYSLTDIGFQRGLYFMGPVSNLPGVIEVLSQFLKDLFLEPELLLYHKELITQEVLNKAYMGRRNITPLDIAIKLKQSTLAKTFLLPFQQKEIENSIDYWLKNKIY